MADAILLIAVAPNFLDAAFNKSLPPNLLIKLPHGKDSTAPAGRLATN